MIAASQYESWNRTRVSRAAVKIALVTSWTGETAERADEPDGLLAGDGIRPAGAGSFTGVPDGRLLR
jgi:hypothetical protein